MPVCYLQEALFEVSAYFKLEATLQLAIFFKKGLVNLNKNLVKAKDICLRLIREHEYFPAVKLLIQIFHELQTPLLEAILLLISLSEKMQDLFAK